MFFYQIAISLDIMVIVDNNSIILNRILEPFYIFSCIRTKL
jgi:hypothetical protein